MESWDTVQDEGNFSGPSYAHRNNRRRSRRPRRNHHQAPYQDDYQSYSRQRPRNRRPRGGGSGYHSHQQFETYEEFPQSQSQSYLRRRNNRRNRRPRYNSPQDDWTRPSYYQEQDDWGQTEEEQRFRPRRSRGRKVRFDNRYSYQNEGFQESPYEDFQTQGRQNRRNRRYRNRRQNRRYRRAYDFNQSYELRTPTFVSIADLEPEQTGINSKCKVTGKSEMIREEGQKKVVEVTIGDGTGCIIAWLYVADIGILNQQNSIIVRNGKVVMKDDKFMRLQVNEFGKVEQTEPFEFEVNLINNLSSVEYEIK